MSLDRGCLYNYGLAGLAHHLGSDQLQLLGVQLDGDLLDFPIWSNYLLDYLDTTWGSNRVGHLLGLQLDHLRLGLWGS